MENLLKYEWQHELIEFEIIDGRVMVNATQMAKIFDKDLFQFTKSDHAKAFIFECQKPANAGLFSTKSEEDLIKSKQKSGTWMHRILALKFAAWLDPAFELWVYSTIDHILFDHYRNLEESLRRSATRQKRMESLRERLNETPEFLELQTLELEERQEAYRRSRENKNQLELFKGTDRQ